ncbi:MAG: lipoate--protein ligase family protein [Caldilineaceae bacterium]|nr:lipoate--protein ligase family protein [Caldilineaceae bacterium]HRJ41281.1 biotin/lipoate A/B protein ligase family protein [Caldilineaceae bacterium]
MTDFSRSTWRLIIEDTPRSGPANMAVDESLAESVAAGDALPTLRFYRWQPAAVSLGRHQPVAEVDQDKIAERGYDLVRRTTGGRAILHTDELTYSIAAPTDEPRMAGGVMDAYLLLSNGLLAGLKDVGLAAQKASGDVRAGRDVSAACFEVPSAYEITAGGRKLMGSAQSRRKGYVLQHGSLPLVGDIAGLVDVLALSAEEAAALRTHLASRACTLAQALGVADDSPQLEFPRVAQAMAAGLARTLQLTWQPGQLTSAENRRAAELIRIRYADPVWTTHR